MRLKEPRQMADSATIMARVAILVVIYFCFPASVLAANYCVDDNVTAQCRNTTGACWTDPAPDIGCGIGMASSGDTVIVRDNGNTASGFTMVDGITIQAEYPGSAWPYVGTVTFPDGLTTAGTVLDGFQIVGSASVYMSAKSAAGINNNAIMQNCIIGDVTSATSKPGIKHEGGTPQILNNEFVNQGRPAIRFTGPAGWDGASGQAMIIKGNNFHANGVAGSSSKRYGEIKFESSSDARYVLIQDNFIHDNASPVGAAGISVDEDGDDTIYITGNEIYNNGFGGFRLETYYNGTGNTHTGRITFSGEANFRFPPSNTSANYTDGAPNKIYSNGRGGIATGAGSTIDIISNEIYNNDWGGIHTGWEETVNGAYTWPSTTDPAVLTIRKNKIYGNGAGTDVAGGGIDVMWASGTIQNNVVYDNKLAGIRMGPGVGGSTISNISHNTVVGNGGGATSDYPSGGAGGGINYHDNTDAGSGTCFDCKPHGTAPVITLKDNVISYNYRAAMTGMGFNNSSGDRDYNLVYFNNGSDTDVCLLTFGPGFCYNYQYGGVPPSTNDIIADPVFVNDPWTTSNDLQLSGISPWLGCASDESSSGACDGTDMGAWGGTGTFSTPYGSGYNVYMDW